MSSTTGSQNLLVNVFRPVYTYNAGTFSSSLQLSNIGTDFTAAIGDSAENVYVGLNAGNASTSIRSCVSNTALGYNAAGLISNVSNSTFLGADAGVGTFNASNVISIGHAAGGAGSNNIYLGNSTKSTGNSNILIGHRIDVCGSSNVLRIGSAIYGNLANRWVGIGTDTSTSGTNFDVSGNANISGILTAGSLSISSFTPTNLVVPGYIRNALTPTEFDISGGNIYFASNISNGNASSTNTIGNVVLTSGVVRAGDPGSISRPTYAFGSDVSTGMFRPTTDQLAFSVAGVQRMGFVGSKTGIGTSTPAVLLEIRDTSATLRVTDSATAAPGIELSRSGNTVFGGGVLTDWRIQTTGANYQLLYARTDVSGIRSQGTPFMINGTSGNIGIGNTNPSYALDISGTTQTSNALVTGYLRNALTPTTFDISGGNISNSGSITANRVFTRNLYAPSTSDVSAIAYINMGTGADNGAGTYSSNLQFLWLRGGGNPFRYSGTNYGAFNSGSFMTYNSGSSLVTKYIGVLPTAQSQLDACDSILTLTSSGRVGVNNATPSYPLDVSGVTQTSNAIVPGYIRNALTPTTYDISSGTFAGAQVGNVTNGTSFPLLVDCGGAGLGLYMLKGANNNAVGYSFMTRPGVATATERFRIDPTTGNIGIGTTSPSYTLDVSAGSTANTMRITAAAYPSILFAGNNDASSGQILYDATAAGNQLMLRTTAGTPLAFQVGGAVERMRIAPSGNVGIRTTAPSVALDVSGDGQFKRKGVSFQVNDTSAAFIELFTASDNYGCYRGNGTLSIFDAGTTRALATTTATPRINLAAENAPSWIAGSLGLGQKTAAYTLDVSGTTFSSNALFPGYIRNALTPSQFDISGGNISNSGAIKTTSLITQNFYPTSTADVSAIAYIRVGAADAPSANLPFLWMRGGGNPYRYAGINYGAFNAGSFMTYNAGSSLVTKYIGALPSAQSQLDACASILTLNTAGQVGIGTLSPAYVLDVSAGTTVPSINMSSWPRVPIGNTYIAKGVASYPAGSTSPPMFSNALQSINTELAVVTNDATYGTYFVIKKSGIWSVHMGPFSNSALGGTGILDASNNFTQLALPPYGPRTIDYSAQTGVSMTSALKYTGFLPSNAGVYYKVVQNNTTLSGNSNSSVFTLSFLAETPAGPANYPI